MYHRVCSRIIFWPILSKMWAKALFLKLKNYLQLLTIMFFSFSSVVCRLTFFVTSPSLRPSSPSSISLFLSMTVKCTPKTQKKTLKSYANKEQEKQIQWSIISKKIQHLVDSMQHSTQHVLSSRKHCYSKFLVNYSQVVQLKLSNITKLTQVLHF